jgi:cob(I)alamin adenosyltransferase
MPSEPQQIGGWDGVERRRKPSDHEVFQYIDDQVESKLKEPGLRIRSFGDIYHAMSIAVVMIAGVAWGLKLEAKIDMVQKELMSMQLLINKGILPITEERVNSLTARLDRREQEGERVANMVKEVQKECLQLIRK